MKVISTRMHGILDYLTSAVLLALPWLFNWSDPARTLLTVLGLGTIAYSLLTRYELGVFRTLSMRSHLILDATSGMILLAAALLLTGERDSVQWIIGALGLMEIGVTAMTDPATNTVPHADTQVARGIRSRGF